MGKPPRSDFDHPAQPHQLALLGAGVFVLSLASLLFTRDVAHIAAVWPANALVLAALLKTAPRHWLPVLSVGAIANLMAALVLRDALAGAVALGVCNLGESLFAAMVLQRLLGRQVDLTRQDHLLAFLMTAGVAAPTLSALSAATALSLLHHMPFWSSAAAWFAPDALGLVTVTPALLALNHESLDAMRQTIRRGRGGLSTAMLAGGLVVVFGQQSYPLLFLVPPALIYVAFDLGLAGSAVALLTSAIIAVVLTLSGHGPAMLIHAGLGGRLAVLQLFLATLTISVLPVAAALARRDRLEAAATQHATEAEAARLAEFEANRLSGMAQQIAGIGHWRRDLVKGGSVWSPQMFRIHGLAEGAPDPKAIQRYHPDDRAAINKTVGKATQDGAPFELTARLIRADDGRERVVLYKGEGERDERGVVIALVGVVRDITEEVTAHQRVEASEQRFRLLAQSATDVVMHVNAEDVIQFISPSIRKYGYAPEEMVGKHGASFIHPEDRARILERVRRIAAGAKLDPNDDRTYRMRRADGGFAWMEGASAIIRDDAGCRVGLISHLRDVTERLSADEALKQSEARYRLITTNATDVIASYGVDAVLTFLSPSVEAVLGYTAEELVGKPTTSFMHAADIQPVLKRFSEAFLAGVSDEPLRFEYRAIRKDGTTIWLEAQAKPIFDAAGALVEFQDVVREITARKQVEAALAESEMRYRVIAENATDVISRTTVTGTFVYLSPSIRDVTGYAPSELVGSQFKDFVHPDDVAATQAVYRQVVSGERDGGEPVIYRARHKSGDWISLEGNPTPVRNDAGEVIEFIDVTRNISARVQMEDDLRAARDAAEAATVVKSDFMANMSHEIRTPLTAILGFTGLLAKRPELEDASRTFVGRIATAGEALLAIVNDVLDFSKLEAGLVEISPRPVSPRTMLQDALHLFQAQAEAKGIRLVLANAPLPDLLTLDSDRIRQVLLNLMGNAVKFTAQGEVRVVAAYHADRGALSVRVEDQGVGMSAEAQAKLFKRFSQVDASSTRKHGGTGLGLAICKGLVEAMAGEIGVESEPGKGSVFFFEVPAPLAQAPLESAEPEVEDILDGLRVLVADDNRMNRELVRAILEHAGVEVTEAEDGVTAVEAAMAAPVDVILMDIRMPNLDGPAAARRIRQGRGPNQTVPIIAFSADTDMPRHGGQGSDFDGMLGKPLAPRELLSVLALALEVERETSTSASAA